MRPSGEYRIQITGVSSPLLATPTIKTLLFGWESETEVFAAFDANRHTTFGSSPSIQVNRNTLQKAHESGYAFQTRGNEETIVAFVPDQVVNYIYQMEQLHTLGRNEFEQIFLTRLLEEEPQALEGFDQESPERQNILTSVSRWARDRNFRNRVLTAYGNQCSVCRLQFRLVQAAHIVPVNFPDSNDLTSNGLALCPTDHIAYDRGLLGISPEYRILINQTKLDEIRHQGLNGGEESLLAKASNSLFLPSQQIERPNPDYLRRGMEVRGWSAN